MSNDKPKKKLVDSSFWPALLSLARIYMVFGKKGNICKKLFTDANLELIVTKLKKLLKIDIYEGGLDECKLKEIWHELRQIFTDWLASPNDTVTFKANLEGFYRNYIHYLKEEWIELGFSHALPDEMFRNIFIADCRIFWDALDRGLVEGVAVIHAFNWYDAWRMRVVTMQVKKENLLADVNHFDETIGQLVENLASYGEQANDIQQLIDLYGEVADDGDKAELRDQVSESCEESLKVCRKLKECIASLERDLRCEERKLRDKRKHMRTIETLLYFNSFIGVLLNDSGATQKVTQLGMAMVDSNAIPLQSVHQDKDKIIDRLWHGVMPKLDMVADFRDWCSVIHKRIQGYNQWVRDSDPFRVYHES